VSGTWRTWAAAVLVLYGCGQDDAGRCGPAKATVARVIDGDTVELEGGERVRYLLVDAPERNDDCWGAESAALNRRLVEAETVRLTYDAVCRDRFGRLLAFVEVAGRDVGATLVERGFACVLQVPPNGAARVTEFTALEAEAQAVGAGMWGWCDDAVCRR